MLQALEGYTDSDPNDTTDVSFKMLTDLLELIKELLDYQTNQLCYDNENSFFNLVDFWSGQINAKKLNLFVFWILFHSINQIL